MSERQTAIEILRAARSGAASDAAKAAAMCEGKTEEQLDAPYSNWTDGSGTPGQSLRQLRDHYKTRHDTICDALEWVERATTNDPTPGGAS